MAANLTGSVLSWMAEENRFTRRKGSEQWCIKSPSRETVMSQIKLSMAWWATGGEWIDSKQQNVLCGTYFCEWAANVLRSCLDMYELSRGLRALPCCAPCCAHSHTLLSERQSILPASSNGRYWILNRLEVNYPFCLSPFPPHILRGVHRNQEVSSEKCQVKGRLTLCLQT